MPESELRHRDNDPPLEWVTRFAPLIPNGGAVLDLACGQGRHTRYLTDQGYAVTALDKGVDSLSAGEGVEAVSHDLEDGSPWPFGGREFSGIVVTNYLYRPILLDIVDTLAPGGVLIYQTFAVGNAEFGRPRRPEFLLMPGELLEAVTDRCTVIAYEHGTVALPRPAVVQRICAVRNASQIEDVEPQPLHPTDQQSLNSS